MKGLPSRYAFLFFAVMMLTGMIPLRRLYKHSKTRAEYRKKPMGLMILSARK